MSQTEQGSAALLEAVEKFGEIFVRLLAADANNKAELDTAKGEIATLIQSDAVSAERINEATAKLNGFAEAALNAIPVAV